jgi:hypothetical protein
MNQAPPRSGGGINRAALKSGPPRRAEPAREATRAPVARVAPVVVVRPSSAMGEFLQVFGGVSLGAVVIVGLLMSLHLIRDSVSVGKHLAEAKSQRGTLVCQDGRIVRGDGSLRDIILESGYFVCTDWRTLQSVEQEEADKRR